MQNRHDQCCRIFARQAKDVVMFTAGHPQRRVEGPTCRSEAPRPGDRLAPIRPQHYQDGRACRLKSCPGQADMGRGQQGRSGTHGSLPRGCLERSRRPGCRRPRSSTTMTNNHEPRVRELPPAEIEALRQEMTESIKWAKTELARRRDRLRQANGQYGLDSAQT